MTTITTRQDAFGQAMYDQFHGTDAYEIVERDDGSCMVSGGPTTYLAEFNAWSDHQKKAIRLARGRVLDIGCGAGRVALHLQDKGCDVTGIDVSPLALKVCKARGLKKTQLMSITQITRKLGEFDTIVMYGNGFGLFASEKRAKWLLRRFHGMTSNAARIIVESRNPYETDEKHHLDYHKRNRKRGRMAGEARIRVRYKTLATPWFDYLLVSQDEMTEIVAGTGWRIRGFFESAGKQLYTAVFEKEHES